MSDWQHQIYYNSIHKHLYTPYAASLAVVSNNYYVQMGIGDMHPSKTSLSAYVHFIQIQTPA